MCSDTFRRTSCFAAARARVQTPDDAPSSLTRALAPQAVRPSSLLAAVVTLDLHLGACVLLLLLRARRPGVLLLLLSLEPAPLLSLLLLLLIGRHALGRGALSASHQLAAAQAVSRLVWRAREEGGASERAFF